MSAVCAANPHARDQVSEKEKTVPQRPLYIKTLNSMLAALAISIGAAVAPDAARAQHRQPTPAMSAYFNMLFSGDLSGAPQLFADNADDPMVPMLKSRFEARFIDRTSSLDLAALESPKVRALAELYQTYWRDALMRVAPPAELEAGLVAQLDQILGEEGFDAADDDEDAREANIKALIEREGAFAQNGRTPPLQDLMIWTQNTVSKESIELTDGVFDVDVNFLGGFVSYGWMNFGSFGMTSAGGWAKKDGLYCVCETYDQSSERYRLSFLKHEARHYVDFKLYPELKAPDLEYRGKLTELAFAEEGLYQQLAQFTSGANKIDNAPHPLANWYIVDGLSRLLLDGNPPADASAWQAVPKDKIRKAARRLLKEHDQALKKQGAKTTEGVIAP